MISILEDSMGDGGKGQSVGDSRGDGSEELEARIKP